MRAFNIIVAAAVSSLLAASVHAQNAPRIGSAAITVNAVSGSLGTTRRDLKRGDGVFKDEMIATGEESRAQILFADETALTIGPKSEIVLDKFAYDPDKKTGEVSLRAVTGAFRFVSGSAQKDAYKIITPAGSIGIRGTIIEFNIVQAPAGWIITLTLKDGETTFCLTPAQCTELKKPGTYIVVSGNQVSAEQVLNALGCGAGKCNETSYNQGDQTTYIAFFTDNKFTTPHPPNTEPPSNTGENPFQIALRAYLQHVVARLNWAKHHNHVHGFRLFLVNYTINRLTYKVEHDLIPNLDTFQELQHAKWVVRHEAHRILDLIRHRHPGYLAYLHHQHHHHRRHHRHHGGNTN